MHGGDWRTKSLGFDTNKAVPVSNLRAYTHAGTGVTFSHPVQWAVSTDVGPSVVRFQPSDAQLSREAYWIAVAQSPSGLASARDEQFRPFAEEQARRVAADSEIWSVEELSDKDGAHYVYKSPSNGAVSTTLLCCIVGGYAVAVCGGGEASLVVGRESILHQIFCSVHHSCVTAPSQQQQQQQQSPQDLVGTWVYTNPPLSTIAMGAVVRSWLSLSADGRMLVTESAGVGLATQEKRRTGLWRAHGATAFELIFDDDRTSRMLQWTLRRSGIGAVTLCTRDQAGTSIEWMRG